MNDTPAISITGFTKRFGDLVAVDDLDLHVPAGQILALLGPNGAGKSTTTEAVIGLTGVESGRIEVFGSSPIAAVRSGDTGAMLQNGTLLAETSVRNLLRLMHGLHRHPLPMDEVIERAELGPILRSGVGKLSGGQAQRLRFALAIMSDPRLLILDEPTVGMDVDARRRFWATMDDLADGGRTIMFATHYLEEADDFADRIVVMNAGRVVADGTGDEIKSIVGGRHIRFHGPARNWDELPGVVSVAAENGGWVLNCSDSDAALRALLTDPEVRDVDITSPSLEDAFVELVA
ncbi:ABC transporter ATP-binding protein [Enemella sp. A6]|uniref:ABC transporter ATP-binding protein n=1 Tax=Enemella sp. A6 TaxID=3440152 RepID=UPI003EBB3108